MWTCGFTVPNKHSNQRQKWWSARSFWDHKNMFFYGSAVRSRVTRSCGFFWGELSAKEVAPCCRPRANTKGTLGWKEMERDGKVERDLWFYMILWFHEVLFLNLWCLIKGGWSLSHRWWNPENWICIAAAAYQEMRTTNRKNSSVRPYLYDPIGNFNRQEILLSLPLNDYRCSSRILPSHETEAFKRWRQESCTWNKGRS